MRKVMLLTLFLFIPPVFLLSTAVSLYYISIHSQTLHRFSASGSNVAYAALPTAENNLNGMIEEKDARVEIVKSFFNDYKSPLTPYAQNIVSSADKYNIDFRLLPAIAMQESNLCKKIRQGSNNCWGFGIYGKTFTTFDNYPQAINQVSKTLASDYVSKGLKTPEEIMKKYTPSNNGQWADSVNHFMGVLSISSLTL